MAFDSIIGGVAARDSFVNLSSTTKDVLEASLGDVDKSQIKEERVGADAHALSTKSTSGGTKTVVYPDAGKAATGIVKSGNMDFTFELPKDATAAIQSFDATTTNEVKASSNALVDKVLPAKDPESQAANAQVKADIDTLIDAKSSKNITFVAKMSKGTEPGSTVVEAGAQPVVVVMSEGGVASRSTNAMSSVGDNVELRNTDAAVIIGKGNVTITNAKGATVVAGLGEQNIMGGSGNDTMITTGGKDSMSGGAGADKFVMTGKSGNLAISDFKIGEDKLVFKIDGISNLADLTKAFTGVTETPAPNAGVTVHFGDLTVTLTGLKVSDLTLDMLGFTL